MEWQRFESIKPQIFGCSIKRIVYFFNGSFNVYSISSWCLLLCCISNELPAALAVRYFADMAWALAKNSLASG